MPGLAAYWVQMHHANVRKRMTGRMLMPLLLAQCLRPEQAIRSHDSLRMVRYSQPMTWACMAMLKSLKSILDNMVHLWRWPSCLSTHWSAADSNVRKMFEPCTLSRPLERPHRQALPMLAHRLKQNACSTDMVPILLAAQQEILPVGGQQCQNPAGMACSGSNDASAKDGPLEDGLSSAWAWGLAALLIITAVGGGLIVQRGRVISNLAAEAIPELVNVPELSCIVRPLAQDSLQIGWDHHLHQHGAKGERLWQGWASTRIWRLDCADLSATRRLSLPLRPFQERCAVWLLFWGMAWASTAGKHAHRFLTSLCEKVDEGATMQPLWMQKPAKFRLPGADMTMHVNGELLGRQFKPEVRERHITS